MAEIEEAIARVWQAGEKPDCTDKDKRLVAYHEAGHAVVAKMLPNADPVRKVSLYRGQAGGYTQHCLKRTNIFPTAVG